ncbi:MAG: sugar phosphate nucleotidyltransferase [Candidatus Omnitrophota bacterium]|nr:CBS domain-containing protein [Candidatus Omnitrophota bacterium]
MIKEEKLTEKFLVDKKTSIKEAMMRMSEIGVKVLFVIDDNNKILGSLTDGDIRRWILKEGGLGEKVDQAYNRNPIFLKETYSVEEAKKAMLNNNVEGIPVVNNRGEVIEVLLWSHVFGREILPKQKLDMPVVIMAGGKGARLDPLTRILPKPLIPIGERAIIDIIMERFSHHGIEEFYISINHKAKMIKSYFEEMGAKYTVRYIEEEKPLGTAGSLRFLQGRIQDSLLVSNCDIVVDCDYGEVIEFHNKYRYDITVIGSFKHFIIPYGVCEIEKDGLMTNITEKPEYDFLVNTGVYVLRKNTLDLIEAEKVVHITDLIKAVRDNGGRVGVFPISEKSWIDVGQLEEYRKTIKLLGGES